MNCQAEKCDMWPKKPQMDIQSNGPTMLIQHKMTKKSNIVPQADDKNCQSIKNVKSKFDDLNSQSTVKMCSDKKYQENIDMQLVESQMDVWLKKPAKLQSSYRKKDELKYVYEDKNFQDTICHKTQKKIDKNFQTSDMQSVINTDNMWLPKPAVPYEYSRLCKDKNYQSTRCYKKRNNHKTVNLCNLNLKELCYYHTCTAMKTLDMWTVPEPELVSTKIDCKWIVHSRK